MAADYYHSSSAPTTPVVEEPSGILAERGLLPEGVLARSPPARPQDQPPTGATMVQVIAVVDSTPFDANGSSTAHWVNTELPT